MTSPEWWADSLVSAGERIARGEISSRELTEAMLERVKRCDGRLKSYAALAPETALRAAAKADEDIHAGRRRGPLHGVPLAVKDAFYTLDIKTGLGSSIYDGWRPPFELTATRRLREAGGVLLGKLKLTEGVYADHHPTIEPPINPFNADHWTGTSSSGSGVAVTAGLCYGSLATDTGGSIRLPSSCCGVVGVKPTWGRVSRNGVFPLAESRSRRSNGADRGRRRGAPGHGRGARPCRRHRGPLSRPRLSRRDRRRAQRRDDRRRSRASAGTSER